MTDHHFYLVEKQPPLAWVFLNRPEKKNAMGPAAWTEPLEIFTELDGDPEIRVVIVAGKGACFSAGIDLLEMVPQLPELMDKNQTGATKWKFLPKIKQLQDGISAIERCRKPVIAAIHGHCIGAGLDMVTACDIRICSEDARFSLKEAAVGFVADVGVLQRLPLIVGQGHARELAYTARYISATRAREIQLVSDVYSDTATLMVKAEELAREIADNSPLAVQASKDVLNYCVGKSIDDGLKYVASVSANIIPSSDLLEAINAFREKENLNLAETDSMDTDLQLYLEPTFFLDYDTQEVADFAAAVCAGRTTAAAKATALYYAVRDRIKYDPYDLQYSRAAMRASSILRKKSGYCVSKAVLLAAVGRHQQIPCRLGFADVTNHLSTARLREMMGTDLFIYHGYTEMYLNHKWVKATPAFNLSLCTRFNVQPLEFDGTEDSIFHESNTLGQKHMEYVRDHGHFADLPFEEIFAAYGKTYPRFFEQFGSQKTYDFNAEAAAEF